MPRLQLDKGPAENMLLPSSCSISLAFIFTVQLEDKISIYFYYLFAALIPSFIPGLELKHKIPDRLYWILI